MRRSLPRLLPALLVLAVMVMAGTPAYAQGSALSSLSGLVVDSSGGVIPGATVTIKNKGTGESYEAVTGGNGDFNVPALPPGTYAVTVALMGFKTAVLSDVVLNTAVPGTVRVALEVGSLEETIMVAGGTEIVQTVSTAVTTTLNLSQVSNLPLTSRNAMDFIPNLPGVNTPSGNRDSTFYGLPQSVINITVDGMNVQDNYLKSTDGFFARMSPRMDSVEEVTVSTVGQGADAGGQGAAQIRFVTRSGTNEFRGSGYYYLRHNDLNANTWFNVRDNLPKAPLVQHQPGVRAGGPIVIPGLWDGHNKGFFFVNYEELRQPQNLTRTRTIMHPLAQQGLFRYNVTSGGVTQVREVDLLALAAANGHIPTVDPIVSKLLADIRSATAGSGTVKDLTDPSLQTYTYLSPQQSHNIYPTFKLDFNLTDRHRLSGSFNYNHILSQPDGATNSRDPFFPGFPVQGDQDSDRYTVTTALRSTLGSSLVNEIRVGGTGGATMFNPNQNAGMWKGTPIADQGGYQLGINAALSGISNASTTPSISSREASTMLAEDTLNWVKGSHTMGFGFSWTQVDLWLKNRTTVPTINFAIVPGDPADAMFNTTNFPGASSTNLNDARDLYAVLVGRVSAIGGNARLDENTGQYTYMGEAKQRGRMRELSFFAQDSWRMRPSLTLNFGLRYALQFPFYPLNDSYSTAALADAWGVSGLNPDCNASDPKPGECSLFTPGIAANGKTPEFIQFKKGTRAYDVDWNNLAPNIGISWTPSSDKGFLRTLLGSEGDSVIRAGFSTSFNRQGMADFSDVFGANPGVLIDATRNQTLGNLGTLPLLFRETNRLGPPAFPSSPDYPLTAAKGTVNITNSVNLFDPNLQVPYAQTWQVGFQRALSTTMAAEIRYIGTRSRQLWTAYNYNEINVIENGFLNEFKLAQQNLEANIAAGRGSNFRYYGQGTGTSPLPIILAYFSGVPTGQAGDASRYTSTLFANSTFLNPLAKYNPNPCCVTTTANASFAYSLYNDATRRTNALAAGLPSNFFIANPDLQGGANVTGNGGYTNYNGLELELRRRLSNGLQFQTSYTFGHNYESARYSFRKERVQRVNTGTIGQVTHAFKLNWVYQLPFGRGQRFGSDANGFVDRLIGGWSISGTGRIQTGLMLDFGNVRLVGMSLKDLQGAFKKRIADDGKVYMLPQDIIDNTVKAFSVSAVSSTGYGQLGAPTGRYIAPANGPDCIETAPGYGDCGLGQVVVTGPMFKNFDLSFVKQIPIKGRVTGEFRAEMLNAFNWVNYNPVTGMTISNSTSFGSTPGNYEVTGLLGTTVSRQTQLVFRLSW